MRACLRPEHRLTDFLWFLAIGGMPEVIACFAIAPVSLYWMFGYLGFMLLFGVVEVRFLCRHCPYYDQQPGRKVHCKAMWGPSKFFTPRRGPLSALDRVVLYSFFAFAFAFPLYWLIQQPLLLVLYLWSIGNMLLTLGRYECSRCMFFECPFNRVPEDVRHDHQDASRDPT